MPNHASHHHDGAGNASAGSAPTTNAAGGPQRTQVLDAFAISAIVASSVALNS